MTAREASHWRWDAQAHLLNGLRAGWGRAYHFDRGAIKRVKNEVRREN